MTEMSVQGKSWSELTVTVDNRPCRICFSATSPMIPIFRGAGLEQGLQEKIQKYLPVNITETDEFPQSLCCHCANTLIAWDTLYLISMKTDEKLKSLVKGEEREENAARSLNADSHTEAVKCIEGETGDGDDLKPAESAKTSENLQKSNSGGDSNGFEVNPRSTPEEDCLASYVATTGDDKPSEFDGKPLGKCETGGKTAKCERCGKTFKSDRSLQRHAAKVHPNRKIRSKKHSSSSSSFRCETCNTSYKTRANLDRHNLREHLSDQVECPVCRDSFNSRKLDSHLKLVHGVKSESTGPADGFGCKHCDQRFTSKHLRNVHVKDVHLTEVVRCKLCDFEGVRSVVKRHKRVVHAEKRFQCSQCTSAFKTLHTLKMHMTSHSDVRCYTCDVCGMGFKRLNNVQDHMKCHQAKSNQCQICGNFFARKRYLAIHEKTIHNFYADGIVPEEKGFECEICGAKLKWKKNLLAHMRIHTGEKPYVCKICGKDFACHGSLRTHMAKHTVCVGVGDPGPPCQSQVVSVEVTTYNGFESGRSQCQ